MVRIFVCLLPAPSVLLLFHHTGSDSSPSTQAFAVNFNAKQEFEQIGSSPLTLVQMAIEFTNASPQFPTTYFKSFSLDPNPNHSAYSPTLS